MLVLLGSLYVVPRIASATDFFSSPPAAGLAQNFVGNPVWELNSVQNISWYTIYPNYTMDLWQQNLTQTSANKLGTVYSIFNEATPGSQLYQWTVQIFGSDLLDSPVYFFWVNSLEENSERSFTSHYFNITVSNRSSSTSSSRVSSALSTHTSSLTVSSQQSMSTASQSTPGLSSPSVSNGGSSDSSSGGHDGSGGDDSHAESVGLGVGLGIGIPLVLIAGIWIGIKTFRRRKAICSLHEEHAMASSFPYEQENRNPATGR